MESDAFPPRLAAIPFLVGGGIAIGESIAGALIGPDLPKNNDVAGAGVAIMFYLSFGLGFVVSLITIVVRAVLRRQPPARLAIRGVLSVITGAVIGALTWSHLANFAILMAPLILAPIGLAISWPGDDFYY